MKRNKIKKFNSYEKIILYTGILLILWSFISEINFHYIQGFRSGLVDNDIFWRAEMVEVFNSMSFLMLGILLIIAAIYLSKKGSKIISKKNCSL